MKTMFLTALAILGLALGTASLTQPANASVYYQQPVNDPHG